MGICPKRYSKYILRASKPVQEHMPTKGIVNIITQIQNLIPSFIFCPPFLLKLSQTLCLSTLVQLIFLFSILFLAYILFFASFIAKVLKKRRVKIETY